MRTFRRIAAHSPFARLYHQDPFLLIAGIDAEVFHLGFIAIAQIIKPQAVLLLVHQGTELMLKLPALRSIQYALEHGILDALPIVHALLCNQAEPASMTGYRRSYYPQQPNRSILSGAHRAYSPKSCRTPASIDKCRRRSLADATARSSLSERRPHAAAAPASLLCLPQ